MGDLIYGTVTSGTGNDGVLNTIVEVIICALDNVIVDEVTVIDPSEIDTALLLTGNLYQDTS